MPLSDKQLHYLACAWACFESEPKINFVAFAQMAGLSTPASARELMRVTKKKLKAEYGVDGQNSAPSSTTGAAAATPKKGGSVASAATTPKTVGGTGQKRGRKPKVADGELDGEEGDMVAGGEESPTKRARCPTPGKVKVEPDVEEEDGDDIFT